MMKCIFLPTLQELTDHIIIMSTYVDIYVHICVTVDTSNYHDMNMTNINYNYDLLNRIDVFTVKSVSFHLLKKLSVKTKKALAFVVENNVHNISSFA